jgi:hypothetical protein
VDPEKRVAFGQQRPASRFSNGRLAGGLTWIAGFGCAVCTTIGQRPEVVLWGAVTVIAAILLDRELR